jgi:hypothetical protein
MSEIKMVAFSAASTYNRSIGLKVLDLPEAQICGGATKLRWQC